MLKSSKSGHWQPKTLNYTFRSLHGWASIKNMHPKMIPITFIIDSHTTWLLLCSPKSSLAGHKFITKFKNVHHFHESQNQYWTILFYQFHALSVTAVLHCMLIWCHFGVVVNMWNRTPSLLDQDNIRIDQIYPISKATLCGKFVTISLVVSFGCIKCFCQLQ